MKMGIINTWKKELSDKRFRNVFLISVIILGIVLSFLTRFLNYVEAREGIVLNDPVLDLFTATDFTWVIFAIIYISLFTAIFSLLPHPRELLHAIQLYAVMVFIRIIAMFLLPLNPPEDMIILSDPFVEFFGTGKTLTKDLFFSGHTASILIFFFSAQNKVFKTVFLILVFLIGVLVILQKVHYTIDVYAAVLFTIAVYFIIRNLKSRFNI